MKKLLMLVGALTCLNASALNFYGGSTGMKHLYVPTGISTSALQSVCNSGSKEYTLSDRITRPIEDSCSADNAYGHNDHSDKFEQKFPTVNVEAFHRVLLDEKNLLTLSGTVSSGYHSEALTVKPYIKPTIKLTSQVGDDTFLIISRQLPVIGGSLNEKKWVNRNKDGNGVTNWSYATSGSWSDGQIQGFNNYNNKTSVTLTHKFNWFLGTKE